MQASVIALQWLQLQHIHCSYDLPSSVFYAHTVYSASCTLLNGAS